LYAVVELHTKILHAYTHTHTHTHTHTTESRDRIQNYKYYAHFPTADR